MKVKYCPKCNSFMRHYSETHSDENYGYMPMESWFECDYCGTKVSSDCHDDEIDFWEE